MLLQFKAINFQSIKEEAILSMVPSSDKSHPENLAHVGKKDALKSAAIYGANAAGKSAVIRAFVAAIMVVRTSDTRNITQKIPGIFCVIFLVSEVRTAIIAATKARITALLPAAFAP